MNNMSSTSKVHNANCCVYKCFSRKQTNRKLHFHSFPKQGSTTVRITNSFGIVENIDRRKAWINALRMGKPVTPHMRVCSLHFQESDYLAKNAALHMNRPKLLSTAVPSQKLPTITHKTVVNEARQEERKLRLTRRTLLREKQEKPCPMVESACLSSCTTPDTQYSTNVGHQDWSSLTTDERDVVQALLGLRHVIQDVKTKDKSQQVTSGDLCISFSDSIKTDKHLNSLTGIPSIKMLNEFARLITELYPDKKLHKLTVKDRVIIVFMKLKMAIRFTVLSFLFRVCQATIKNVFSEYITYMKNILQDCIHWPTSEECLRNLPLCFENFTDVRIVLDCTEIPVQRPSCLSCRIRTYSHYKGGQTIKFMTGVSAGGLITYLSRGYGGRSSDKAIFEQSKIIEKLDPFKNSIMVDKGFLIEDICHKYSIKLLRPVFLRNKKKFSDQESNYNIAISRARVHIERVNQRLKMFEILKVAFPWSLMPDVDNIFFVLCAMVNLQSSVLQDDKFLLA